MFSSKKLTIFQGFVRLSVIFSIENYSFLKNEATLRTRIL
jgi:hypothetical protein